MTKGLRCPYCLRQRDHETAEMDWCIGKCERDSDVERKATGFVEAQAVVDGDADAFN